MKLPIDRKKGGWLLTILLVVFCVTIGTAHAGDYYVRADGLDAEGCGTGWGNACASVGAALSQAAASDTIHVAAGTYMENIRITGAVSLLGGYPSGGGDVRDAAANPTILDGGNGVGSVISANNATGTIDGFTIRNGHGNQLYGGGIKIVGSSLQITNNYITSNSAKLGGGIYAKHSNGSKIESNIILKNSTSWHGGGIHLVHSNLMVVDNTIKSNTSPSAGGGVYISGSGNGLLEGNTVEGNYSGNGGGGLYIVGSETTISRNNIAGNSTHAAGGGLYLNDYVGVVSNCMITGNHAGNGGGIYAGSSSGSILLLHDTIADNTADSAPGIVSLFNSLIIQNSIVQHDGSDFYGKGGVISNPITDDQGNLLDMELISVPLQVEISYSCISDPNYTDPDNSVIICDPSFVGNGDYHLADGSPCIDAIDSGEGSSIDFDGDTRPQGPQLDMGADEFAVAVPPGGVNQPPECSATASLSTIWPPNHKMVDVHITWALSDPDGDPVTVTIGAISHNDRDDKGTGKTSPDWVIVDNDTVQLRAERSGLTAGGRTYTIPYTADDGQGGVCSGSIQVNVPQNN